jgi:hypothetical protein
MLGKINIGLAVAIACCSPIHTTAAAEPGRLAGIYSSLTYNAESGDLVGRKAGRVNTPLRCNWLKARRRNSR